jgi:hypothetical protein
MRYGACGFLMCLLATACSSSNPSSPSATVTSPVAVAPANGAQIANSAQPVTLIVQNATVTQSAGATYTFEVATDSAFANKVQTKSGVAAGPGGQTSLTLGPLTAGSDYYWHSQAVAGGTTGVFTAASKFTIGASVTLSAPTAISPVNGASAGTQPVLTVVNAMSTGPAGPIAYRFDISTSATFATVVVSGSVVAGAGQTTFKSTTVLTTNATYYWRAVAIDQTNLVTSPASATASFITVSFPGVAAGIANQLGQVLWPGAVPGGTNGYAILGTNCDGTPNWGITSCVGPSGIVFASPTLQMLQIFDLLDRGYDPQSAINWLVGNGYSTPGDWYPSPKEVIGMGNVYLSARPQFTGNTPPPGTTWDVQISLG